MNSAAGCAIVRSVTILPSGQADLPDDAVTREDLAAWDAEFNDICARTGPLFYRTDSRAHAVRYLRGLLAPLERKNGWTIKDNIQGRWDAVIAARRPLSWAAAWTFSRGIPWPPP